jgi:hypothetical protein
VSISDASPAPGPFFLSRSNMASSCNHAEKKSGQISSPNH